MGLKPSIMDRYLIAELLPPFLFGVAAFSAIGLAVGVFFDLVQKITDAGIPFATAIQIFLLQVPNFVTLSFPMSILLATLMVYSRLSGDSEIVALRGCGVSVYRLMVPALMLSLIATGMTFFLNELVVPSSNYQGEILLEKALSQDKLAFQEKNIFYQEFSGKKLARIFYAHDFDGQRMQNLTILDFSKEELNQIVEAESAVWNAQQSTWDFANGTIYIVAPDGSSQNLLKFERHQLRLPRAPLDLANKKRKSDQMNIAQVQERLALLEQKGDEKKEIRKYRVRIQEKLALPFICVALGLVGAALGTTSRRTNTSTGFGISILIIFGYYLIAFVSNALGETGAFSPFLAGWLPILVGLTAGGGLLIRAAR
ncbi:MULTISPECIES: LptF/LptG family permease [Trichocoleus]|uniref:LptF/LptG family permease n=1 Tax=Trichocoleus desertorum GB2-A4 TaxID=2933944 RepID=A0ABV0J6J7_9CYAN|nr:LptF/LptG family permease [Trichocoleus sp. FACHB-46]